MRLLGRISLIAVALCTLVPTIVLGNVLFPDIIGSNPTDAESNVLREQGRKGLLLKFNYTDDVFNPIPGGFPLDLSAATVTLTIGGASQACSAGAAPSPGNCTYRNVDGETPDGQLDYVEILYNGDLPPNTSIQFSVTGTESAMGETQDGTTPHTVTFTTGSNTPREAASVELVVDISGSMGLPAVPAGPVERMDALKSAVQVLFQMVGDHAMVGDKLGVTYFSTNATVFDPTPGGTNLEPAHDLTQMGLIAANVNAQIPTNATSIGAGLQVANASGFAADPAPNAEKFALLFSDGEQNTAPDVAVVGNSIQVGGVNYPADITVCPVTAGRMTAPGFALQQSIATASCGGHNAAIQDTQQTFVDADLETFFAQAMSTFLVGDKLEVARNTTGKIKQSEVVTETFLANPGDISISLLLSWRGGSQRDLVSFELEAPDGTTVQTDGFTRLGRRMSFTTIPMPLSQGGTEIQPAGEWKVKLFGKRIHAEELDFHLMAILDNRTIATGATVSVNDPGTGEDIPVTVKLAEAGSPVLGAVVTAKVIGPKDGQGEVLSSADNPADPMSSPDSGANAAALAKLRALLADPASASLFANQSLPTLTLVDDGSGDDPVPGDGVYSAVFRGADEEGHYHIVIDVEAIGSVNGQYRRTWQTSVFVRPKPEPDNTLIEETGRVILDDGMIRVRYQATPRDRFDNRIGPGYIGYLEILSSEGTQEGPIVDLLDGRYEAVYRLPSSASDPEITLQVMGDEIKKVRPKQGDWRLFLNAGWTSPHSALGTGNDGSLSLGLGIEKPLTGPYSFEAYLGHDRFDSSASAQDPHFTHLSARFRWTPTSGVWRPTAHIGVGGYLDRNSDLNLGAEAGVGLQVWVSSQWAAELGYIYRNVDSGAAQYSILHGGVRFQF